MTAQVIFLNNWLDCPDEKRQEHEKIQILICERKAEFEYETRNYNHYQKAISKQKSHHLWRQRMRIVKDESTSDIDPDDLDAPSEE